MIHFCNVDFLLVLGMYGATSKLASRTATTLVPTACRWTLVRGCTHAMVYVIKDTGLARAVATVYEKIGCFVVDVV